jgi:hypothetical protein
VQGVSMVPMMLVAEQKTRPKSPSSDGWNRSTECVLFDENLSLEIWGKSEKVCYVFLFFSDYFFLFLFFSFLVLAAWYV